MKKLIVIFTVLSVLFFSCVIPEKFTCNINVDAQGAYSVDFKGTLLFWAALEQVAKSGKISSDVDSQIKSAFEEWVDKEPTIKKYEYRNQGRAYVEYYEKVPEGKSLDLSNSFGMPLNIKVDNNGNITITEKAVNGKELTEFVKLGYKLDGVIEITSELPIVDAGEQKVSNKFVLFGPQVIKQVFTTFPTKDIVIKIKKER